MQRECVTLCLVLVQAISHHSGYVMFAVHVQQTCEMNVNEAASSFSYIVGSCSLPNTWIPQKSHN